MESSCIRNLKKNHYILCCRDSNNRSVIVVHILMCSLHKLNKDEAIFKLVSGGQHEHTTMLSSYI